MTDVATWSQLLSSIAVLGTLIYLAVEIRQNTAAERASTRLGTVNLSMTELHRLIEHPDLYRCLANRDPLQSDEAVRLHAFLLGFMRHMEYVWRQYKRGAAEDYEWRNHSLPIRSALKAKRSERWWQALGRYAFDASFVEEVDALLKDQPNVDVFNRVLGWGSEDLRG